MEKYSQYRDRGSGIAPFLPVSTQPSGIYLPFHVFLFLIRLPILVSVTLSYFFVLQWLPIGSLGKKASLWLILGTPGVWWIDLQIDGVKKGSLAKHHKARLPQPGSIIASSYTSPLDALYLAAIFDPVFTASYSSTPQVERISLFHAIIRSFQQPQVDPPKNARLTDLRTLIRQHPCQAIVVFPECTTTNGRAILPFSPSLLTAPPAAKIFPINLRYTEADITTPIPGTYISFLWNLLSKPTHCIRVRIAESVHNQRMAQGEALRDERTSSSETLLGSEEGDNINVTERRVLDRVADALARLGRVKRVGLDVRDKQGFIEAWTKQRTW
ncbi:MAG: hypothetical protein Q9163_005876 [Psora crenata]